MTSHEAGFTGTEEYYERRANEYDDVYRKPERQSDLRLIESWLKTTFMDSSVLEIAAGTGYWTQFFADSARSVTATDLNDAVLTVAKSRRSWPPSVDFVTANAFELADVQGTFDTAFVGFFWSHLMLDQLGPFVAQLAQRLKSPGRIVFIDNRYVEGSNYPVTKTDAAGNTFQRRRLNDGTTWDVLKNFPTPDEVTKVVAPIAASTQIQEHEFYWIADVLTL